MPWTKPLSGTETARVDNANLQLRFYFGDASANPPNMLRAELTVRIDGPGGVVREQQADAAVSATSLSAGERTTLMTLLGKLRDDGLTLLGFTNT